MRRLAGRGTEAPLLSVVLLAAVPVAGSFEALAFELAFLDGPPTCACVQRA